MTRRIHVTDLTTGKPVPAVVLPARRRSTMERASGPALICQACGRRREDVGSPLCARCRAQRQVGRVVRRTLDTMNASTSTPEKLIAGLAQLILREMQRRLR